MINGDPYEFINGIYRGFERFFTYDGDIYLI